jgi:hypothetical protein
MSILAVLAMSEPSWLPRPKQRVEQTRANTQVYHYGMHVQLCS